MWGFRGFTISDHMLDAISNYVVHGLEPGSFLTAVICNDLKGAISYADDTNIRNLPAFVAYFYNKTPIGCWGSKENMQEWMKERREKS